jgi:hypothetical protein
MKIKENKGAINFCSHCGQFISPEAVFYKNCGVKIKNTTEK